MPNYTRPGHQATELPDGQQTTRINIVLRLAWIGGSQAGVRAQGIIVPNLGFQISPE